VIFNLLRIQKELGMKTAVRQVDSSEFIASSENGTAQDNRVKRKRGGRYA
jgi:hypothetical protein